MAKLVDPCDRTWQPPACRLIGGSRIQQRAMPERIKPSSLHGIITAASLDILSGVIVDISTEMLDPRSIESLHVTVVGDKQFGIWFNIGSRYFRDDGVVTFVARSRTYWRELPGWRCVWLRSRRHEKCQ